MTSRELVSRVRGSPTKSSDRREDLIGALGPDERLRLGVRVGEVGTDGGLELAGAAVHAAPQLLFGERGEPALDQAEPGGARRGGVGGAARRRARDGGG